MKRNVHVQTVQIKSNPPKTFLNNFKNFHCRNMKMTDFVEEPICNSSAEFQKNRSTGGKNIDISVSLSIIFIISNFQIKKI